MYIASSLWLCVLLTVCVWTVYNVIFFCQGAGLDQGIRLSDITVNAGDCQGRVSNLAFNALLVELCSDLEIGKDYDLEVSFITFIMTCHESALMLGFKLSTS